MQDLTVFSGCLEQTEYLGHQTNSFQGELFVTKMMIAHSSEITDFGYSENCHIYFSFSVSCWQRRVDSLHVEYGHSSNTQD